MEFQAVRKENFFQRERKMWNNKKKKNITTQIVSAFSFNLNSIEIKFWNLNAIISHGIISQIILCIYVRKNFAANGAN